ncbi:hypothetical protein J132_07830 [Termitomyces sp. J132]|nr:hypothetical protein J132_07830 [Termitomyces sp. J132]
MDDLTVGMMVSAPAVTSASDTTKHPVGALAVVRGEGWSKGCRGKEVVNCGDIQEAGPSTPKAVAGGIARGLATTLKSKGKGKAKAQDKEDKDIEVKQIEETFTDKCLVTLLCWQKASTVVDTGLGAGMKLEKAKGKVTVLLVKRQEYKRMQGACNNCWANNDPESCCGWSLRSTGGKFAKKIAMKVASVRNARASVEQQRELVRRGESIELKPSSLSLPTLQEEVTSGSSGGTKVKSKEWVESDEDGGNDGGNNDNDDEVPLAQKQAARPASVASAKRPQTVASKEGEGDMEMMEMTFLATVAEVEQEASNMEVKGKEEFEAAPAAIEEDEEEERAEEVEGTWSDTPLRQVGNDELEWLSKDLGWLTLLTSAASLVDFDKRVAGVEWQFQRELEAAREELLAVWARYTVAK